MNRRNFSFMLGGALGLPLMWPAAARAQSPAIPVIGYAGIASAVGDRPFLEALRKGLRDIGRIEGQNIRIEARHADGDIGKAPAIIAELVALKVDIIVAPGPAIARIARRATTLPIVALQLPPGQSNPDLYESLARPGGNLTGFSSMGEGLSAKRIQLLKELMPGLATLGVLHNGTDPTFRDWGGATEADARAQGLRVVRRGLQSASVAELDQHITALREQGATAVIVIRDFITTSMVDGIVKSTAGAGMAVVAEHRDFVDRGALLSYGPDIFDLFRRAGGYIEKILKGEKPGDLPIQLPTTFELVINAKTAKTLGLTIPPTLLAFATEVIE